MVDAGAKLMAHVKAKWLPADSQSALMDKLRAVPTPEPTKTWKPVPHAQVVEDIQSIVAGKGWQLNPRRSGDTLFDVALGHSDKTMFGVCDVITTGEQPGQSIGLALGFRNSHDKTLALGVAAGARVFVCDNLAFSGETIVKRIHRPDLDPRALIELAVQGFAERAGSFAKKLDSLQVTYLAPAEAAAAFMSMARHKVISRSRVYSLWNDYSAKRAGSEPRESGESKWFLYQFVTDKAFKESSPLSLVKRSQALNAILLN